MNPNTTNTGTENRIGIFLIDDHQIVLDGLRSLIEKESDLRIIGECTDGELALEQLKLLQPQIDVLVLDVSMPRSKIQGTELCQVVKDSFPNMKVLILTMHSENRFINSLIGAGADGYILKNKGKEELVEALRTLADGDNYYGKEITKLVMKRIKNQYTAEDKFGEVRLTSREVQVLSLVGQGLTSREVAEKLFIGKATVETHKNNIREKLNLRDVKQMMIFARENGYITS